MANGDDALTTASRIAFFAAECGSFVAFDRAWRDLDGASAPVHAAWREAMRARRWSFDPTSTSPPTPADLHIFSAASSDARIAAARAAAVMERASIATLDRDRLGVWIDVHEGLASQTDEAGDLELRSARVWHGLLAADPDRQEVEAQALFDEASRRGAAAQVIESTVARALIALARGAVDDAVELARRASRMAQAEGRPASEYLANITLARVRRYSGRPHLALHILAALGRVASPLWSGWIGWETQLAGGDVAAGDDGQPSPARLAQRDLAALLAAAHAGDRARFADAAASVRRSAAVWPALAREVEALVPALDPDHEPLAELGAWCRGETVTIPGGLQGVGIPRGADSEATAFVLAQPGVSGRRFLRPGLAIAPAARQLTREAAKSAPAGVRTETGVAALALAGPTGLTREDFFRRVYGFPFVAQRHQAVLDVLCHRMRQLVGPAGEIRRYPSAGAGDGAPGVPPVAAGPSLALDLREAIIVRDMRCALPTADRVLRALATLGTTSASATADTLRMPLRTVQAVLQQLVAEGACSVERDGRHVAYRIEDTSYTEVTIA